MGGWCNSIWNLAGDSEGQADSLVVGYATGSEKVRSDVNPCDSEAEAVDELFGYVGLGAEAGSSLKVGALVKPN